MRLSGHKLKFWKRKKPAKTKVEKPDPLAQFLMELGKFEQAGNEVIGRPARVLGTTILTWRGSGSRLVFGANVELFKTTLNFNAGGGEIGFADETRPSGKFIVAEGGRIAIGRGTRFNKMAWLQAHEGKAITVGEHCLFADVRVRTSDLHSIISLDDGRRLNASRDVEIEDRVWLAEKAHIYKGSRIGRGSIVGAHAVVSGQIPAFTAIAGNPAKVIRTGVTWVWPMTAETGAPDYTGALLAGDDPGSPVAYRKPKGPAAAG